LLAGDRDSFTPESVLTWWGAVVVRRTPARLTPRERQVLDGVLKGRLNKQIAWDLGTAEKTVKVHRGRMMKKMGVRTVADLIRIVTAHGTFGQLSPGPPRD
jgi:FixJ family two-component response regulator